MNSLDLAALEMFRQVAVDGSITRAATKLNRVQSNISMRIKQLEGRLGTELFIRRRRGLDLTDDGRILLGYAERLLDISAEATEALSNGRPSGIFRIGTMESTAATRLPELLSSYHSNYPDVEIQLETDTAGGLLHRLKSKDIDVAFIAEPVTVDGLQTRAVFEEQLVLVAPATFPSFLQTAEISGKTIVAFEEGCAYRRYLDDWLLNEGIVPGKIMSVPSYLAIFACVSAGTGYALAPKSVLEIIAGKGKFSVHKLPKRYSKIKTLLVWRENYRSSKLDALEKALAHFKRFSS